MGAGIYKIVSGNFPDREYIGSAVNLDQRRKRHFRELRKKRHHNALLQNHYNKYGRDDLWFCILEICNKKELVQLEQIYIDRRKPFFNINPTAGSRLGSKHSDQTKLAIGRATKEKPRISVLARYARYFK